MPRLELFLVGRKGTNCRERRAWVTTTTADASRRGNKVQNLSRDKNARTGPHRAVMGGEPTV